MSNDDAHTGFTPPTIEEIAGLLPNYEIISFIAQGGMGAVYLANQKSLDRPVAIKILPRHFGEDAEFRASFEAEAKSMAKLNHPNLIGIYDFGQVDGLLYIIMEMVKGKSLYHSAYGKTIAPTEAARIVRDICRGLANAHKHGILHRDIKPANILLDPMASPKIGDFGLARPVGEHEKDSAFGTPGYTAPEVIHNPKAVDESTDIFAVGVLLYELLTAKLPESIYTSASATNKCNPKFDQIIRKAIHPTPAMRFRSADAMADALESLTKEEKNVTPLLAASPVISRNAPAKTLLTVGSSPTGAPTGGPRSTINPYVNKGSNIPFIRNIIVIIALLAVIVIAWEGLKKVEAHRATEKQRVAKLKKEDAEKKAKDKAAAKNKTANKPKTKPAKSFDIPKARPESAMETLNRLQPQLKRGIRTEMPKGCIGRAGRIRFHIKDEMSWHHAQAFCESYGGHLSVLPENSDLSWITSQLKSGETIWLGAGSAGNKEWCWIDGSPWKLNIRTTSNAACVAVDDTAILTPRSAAEKHSFFIEWKTDGSTTASVKKQLQRCAKSLKSANPSYPAGTVTYDSRNFLMVGQSTTWTSANEMAKSAGGSLAIPSTPDESQWMFGFAAAYISNDQACWIGALREAKSKWHWISGEPWTFAKWAPDSPTEDTSSPAVAALVKPGNWKDFPMETRLDYFIIEWSKDGQGGKTATNPSSKSDSGLDTGLIAKRQKCARILQEYQKTHDKNLTNNIKGYEQDLRSYQRSLPKSQQEAYGAGILEMISRYTNNRIPEDLPRGNMPAKAAKILNDRLKKQARLESEYLSKTEDIREKYRRSLYRALAHFKEKGLTTNIREIQNEIDHTGEKGSAFIDYIIDAP